MEVYSDIFRLGENEIQRKGAPKGQFKANPVGYYSDNRQKSHFRILFDDNF